MLLDPGISPNIELNSSLLYPDTQPHAKIQFSSGFPYISTNENRYEVDIASVFKASPRRRLGDKAVVARLA